MTEKYLIIDSHHHYCPEEAAGKLCTVDGMDYTARRKERGSSYFHGQEIERTINLMEKSGLDMAVINQSAWSPCGLDICKEINNAYAKVVKEFPGRFIACAHIPLQVGSNVLNELDRAINDLGLKGVSLVASTSKVSLGSTELFPIYNKISRLDIPIAIHPTVRTPLWGGTGFIMGSGVSREYDIVKVTVEVMFTVLKEYPNLKFLMPHYGGGIIWFKGRIRARYEPEGYQIPPDIKGAAKTPRDLEKFGIDRKFEEIFGKLFFDTAGSGGWMPNFDFAIKTVKNDRLCFGTDYPFDFHTAQDVKAFINSVKGSDIAEKDKRNILGENVKKLFKL